MNPLLIPTLKDTLAGQLTLRQEYRNLRANVLKLQRKHIRELRKQFVKDHYPSSLPGRTRGDQHPPSPVKTVPPARNLGARKSEDSPLYPKRPAAPITRREDKDVVRMSMCNYFKP